MNKKLIGIATLVATAVALVITTAVFAHGGGGRGGMFGNGANGQTYTGTVPYGGMMGTYSGTLPFDGHPEGRGRGMGMGQGYTGTMPFEGMTGTYTGTMPFEGHPGGHGHGLGMGQGYTGTMPFEGMMGTYTGTAPFDGRMGAADFDGPLHDLMLDAFAKAVKLTRTDLDARLAKGETLAAIASAQGTTAADFPALITSVRQNAIAQAVTNGDLTQAQADWLLAHPMGGGHGHGHGMGGFGNDGAAPAPSTTPVPSINS